MRTKEHNKKIGDGVREYYEHETEENREKRINALKERKRIEKALYEKYTDLKKILNLDI